jgi:L-cysteine:1D-myo-inositol 2-amino-2-deoxy-alpha-D-glucopyranoside ligase
MSKSKGNLVKVSELRQAGEDPMAIRLALLGHHHGEPWYWTSDELAAARQRLSRWRSAVARPTGPSAEGTLDGVRRALADDLDTPTAVAAIDEWVAAQESSAEAQPQDAAAPDLVRRTADALLGIDLSA